MVYLMNNIKYFVIGLVLVLVPFSLQANSQIEQRTIFVTKTYQDSDGLYYSEFKDLDDKTLYKQEGCYKLKRYVNSTLYVYRDVTRNMYFISCTFI